MIKGEIIPPVYHNPYLCNNFMFGYIYSQTFYHFKLVFKYNFVLNFTRLVLPLFRYEVYHQLPYTIKKKPYKVGDRHAFEKKLILLYQIRPRSFSNTHLGKNVLTRYLNVIINNFLFLMIPINLYIMLNFNDY